jgi:multiple sugar transport system substrate-binding protein
MRTTHTLRRDHGVSARRGSPPAAAGAPRLTRRAFLRAAGAGALAAGAAGAAPGLLGRGTAAPAALKGTALSVLQATYFIPAAQDLFKKQVQEWGRANGVNANADFLNWPDLQPKISAAIQAGGYDIVELWPGWNYLYADSLVDVTDLAEAVAKRDGGLEPFAANDAKVGSRFLGVPHGQSNDALNYRISWLRDAGVNVPDPEEQARTGKILDLTWDQFFAIGRKLKAAGHPIGQAFGHSQGDPPSWAYPYMWSNGAMEVEKDGKTVAFNKPMFVDAMKKLVSAWKESFDETGLSWDDSSNNKAFLAGQIAATLNGSSIYAAALKDYPDIAKDMNHTLIPRGPAGRFALLGTRTLAILKNSKNVAGAKEFLAWWFEDRQYGDWLHIQAGYNLPATKKWAKDPMWGKDPVMYAFSKEASIGRDQGWAGPPNAKSGLVFSKYIIVDTYARAIQSGDAAGAIKWGADQLEAIYSKG